MCIGMGKSPKALPVCICHQSQPPIVPGHLPEDGEQEQQCLREQGVVGRWRNHLPTWPARRAGAKGPGSCLRRGRPQGHGESAG